MKNRSRYDSEIQIDLMKITSKRVKVVFVVVDLILILIGIINFKNNMILSIILFAFAVISMIISVFFLEKLSMRKYKKNPMFNGELYNSYVFNSDDFAVDTIRNGKNISHSVMKYTELARIIETEKYIYMYFSNSQAFGLSKDGMTSGSIDELINFLKTKTRKYIKIK